MIMPGEEVVEDDFFVDLDAPLDDQDEIRFEDELVRIASAERDAAADAELIRLG
jgi:hypothetical protein